MGNASDELFMERCFQLANLGLGRVSPNPLVGAVIVHEGRVIGEGYHEIYGQAHAERNALASVSAADRQLIADATLYCNLEPCAHFGKQPPCANLILEHNIKRVVVSNLDTFPEVAGKGFALLRDAGVEVISGVLEQKGRHLNRTFFTFVEKKRPYIVLKYAQTQDGFLGKKNERVQISNKTSQLLVHKWRSETDAILVGTETALIDNPQLNNRRYFGKSPLRIVLDQHLRLPAHLHLFDKKIKTFVFTANPSPPSSSEYLQYFSILFDNYLINNILHILYINNIQSLIVEGGAYTMEQFLAQGLWDEARVFRSKWSLGEGLNAPTWQYFANCSQHKIAIGEDELFIFHPKN